MGGALLTGLAQAALLWRIYYGAARGGPKSSWVRGYLPLTTAGLHSGASSKRAPRRSGLLIALIAPAVQQVRRHQMPPAPNTPTGWSRRSTLRLACSGSCSVRPAPGRCPGPSRNRIARPLALDHRLRGAAARRSWAHRRPPAGRGPLAMEPRAGRGAPPWYSIPGRRPEPWERAAEPGRGPPLPGPARSKSPAA
jgi:hypothetical protein